MMPIARVDEIPLWGQVFKFFDGPDEEEGILLRLASGEVRAYLNECRHLPMRLDSEQPNDLWDETGDLLCCSVHGAKFRPQDGLCVAGLCAGEHLHTLPIKIMNGEVYLEPRPKRPISTADRDMAPASRSSLRNDFPAGPLDREGKK